MERPVPYDVSAILRPAKVLIVVPPFAGIDRPSLGVHILQALARRAGIEVQVLYANMLFAAYVDHGTFATVASAGFSLCLGERLFARAAYGTPPMGHDGGAAIDEELAEIQHQLPRYPITTKNLLDLEARIEGYLASFLPAIAEGGFEVVGCSSSFEQNAASIAILGRLKRRRPETITIMGGSNCEGVMADGIAALTGDVDYIFGGESERTFVAFLEQLGRGERPASRTIHGEPCQDLDSLPTPDYADYYAQLQAFVPTGKWAKFPYLSYETSRGCWWGQTSHCTFCGLNGQGMAMREKSPDRAIAELQALLARHPNGNVVLSDNIMPYGYWKSFLPRVAAELPGSSLHYEQKANLSLRQVNLLADAGIFNVQPGIEALSTGLLKLMAKGTTCAQNLALLRYARANGVRLFWTLLASFPNDRLEFYQETLELLPLLVHLNPPKTLQPISLDRFSPYHDHPERFGITSLQPYAVYSHFLPRGAPIETIAYHFVGTYPSESSANPELMAEIKAVLRAWNHAWFALKRPAVLEIKAVAGGYELTDTRGLPGLPEQQTIDEAQAIAALVARPLSARERPGDAWARAHRVVVERDRKLVPLAVASRDLLGMFEDRSRTPELALLGRGDDAASSL